MDFNVERIYSVDQCSSPKSVLSGISDVSETFGIFLIVNGMKHEYDVRYLYPSILKTPHDPRSGHTFSAYQIRRITQLYRQKMGDEKVNQEI